MSCYPLFLLTILLFYWSVLSLALNLRVETMKIPMALEFGCFTDVLLYTLLKVWWGKCKPTKAIQITNTLASMCLARVAESFELLTWSRVRAFSSLTWKANKATGEAGEPPEGAVAANGWAGCFVSELVSCCGSSLQRGRGSQGSFLSHGSWWVSEFPAGSVSTLQNHTWQSCLGEACRVTLSHTCWTGSVTGGWGCSCWHQRNIPAFRWRLSLSEWLLPLLPT